MRRSYGARVTLGLAVFVIVAWTLVPIFVMVWASILPVKDLFSGGLVQWSSGMGLGTYRALFGFEKINEVFGGQEVALQTGFINSALVSLMVAVLGTVMAVAGGYVFGRFRFRYKQPLLFSLLSVRMLPPIALLIPYYILFSVLSLVGTYLGLVLTYLTAIVPLLTWVLMGFFAGLPLEIERAARMDGCGRVAAFWYVTLPMASPGVAAAFIIAAISTWNELLFGLILTGGTARLTLSTALLSFSPTMTSTGSSAFGLPLFSAGSALSALPPLLLAFGAQRFITRLNISDPVTMTVD